MGQNFAKAGQLLCIDTGEYSDYEVIGFFVVLTNFDPMQELSEYKIKYPEQCKDYNFDHDAFLNFLLNKGFLLEIKYGTLYLGAYNECDNVSFTHLDIEDKA